MRGIWIVPTVLLLCAPFNLLAQDDPTAPETAVEQPSTPPADDAGMIDASTLHNNRSDSGDDAVQGVDNAGGLQSDDSSAGWVHTQSESETSSSSTTLTIGDPDSADDNFAPPVRDDKYWEASLAGRWALQGQNSSCTVTLTGTRWGNSGYRFNGPAGCPGSLIGGVTWALEGHKLVVRGPVSPLATFRERSPNRWEGSDKDGNRLSLTR